MWKALAITLTIVLIGAAVVHSVVLAQHSPMQQMPVPPAQMPQGQMQHGRHMAGQAGGPRLPGQDAFGAIAEVVRLLDADPQTDWSKVDLERLRQHLIDMNEVVLRADVKQTPVAGGLAMDVTGTGRTKQAIRAMVVPHAVELDRMPAFAATTDLIPGGVRLTVTAKKPDDLRVVVRLRGLGFVGLLTEGAHHGPHHLAIAKGEALAGRMH